MSFEVLNNGETALSIRNKLNNLIEGVWSKDDLFPQEVLTLYGVSTPTEVLEKISQELGMGLIRDLSMMLVQSLNTTDIDAWTNINVADKIYSSVNASITSGQNPSISPSGLSQQYGGTPPSSESGMAPYIFLGSGGNLRLGILVSPSDNCVLTKINAQLRRSVSGQSGDNPVVRIYAADKITVLGESSQFTFAYDNDVTANFNFPEAVQMEAGNSYLISFERTGSSLVYGVRAGTQTSGSVYYGSSTTWTESSDKTSFTVTYIHSPVEIIWKPVEATEPFTHVAIVTQTPTQAHTNAFVEFYMSDDGINWVKINELSSQFVGFENKETHLKAVLFNGRSLHQTAFGGY